MIILTALGCILVVWVALAVRAIKVCGQHERLALFRLGRYEGVKGPGIVIVVPFIDQAVRVEPAKFDPQWERLPEAVLAKKIEAYVMQPGFSWKP